MANSSTLASDHACCQQTRDRRELLLTLIVRCVDNTYTWYDTQVQQEVGQLLIAVAMFLLHFDGGVTSGYKNRCSTAKFCTVKCYTVPDS